MPERFNVVSVAADTTVQDALRVMTEASCNGVFVAVGLAWPAIVNLRDMLTEVHSRLSSPEPDALQELLYTTRIRDLKHIVRALPLDSGSASMPAPDAFGGGIDFRVVENPVLRDLKTVWSSHKQLGGRFVTGPRVERCDRKIRRGPHYFPPHTERVGNHCWCGGTIS